MSWADWFMVAITVEYAVAGGLYALMGDWPRVGYWVGAVIINVSILMMRP